MIGRTYIGRIVSFDTDRAEIELFDRKSQSIIRFRIYMLVILPESKDWGDLFMEKVIKVSVIDGVVVRAEFNE
jgi:hypothetical protein